MTRPGKYSTIEQQTIPPAIVRRWGDWVLSPFGYKSVVDNSRSVPLSPERRASLSYENLPNGHRVVVVRSNLPTLPSQITDLAKDGKTALVVLSRAKPLPII